MDTADIEAKVIPFIATKVENMDASKINRSSKFDELGLDSMDTIQLLFDAEDAFGMSFDSEEAKGFRFGNFRLPLRSVYPSDRFCYIFSWFRFLGLKLKAHFAIRTGYKICGKWPSFL